MVKLITLEDRRKNLIEELFINSIQEDRCPHIKRDKNGEPYCGKDYKEGKISKQRKMICDVLSLQLWCLNKTRYQNCIFYQGEPID